MDFRTLIVHINQVNSTLTVSEAIHLTDGLLPLWTGRG